MFLSVLFCHKLINLIARIIVLKTSLILRIIAFILKEMIMPLLILIHLLQPLLYVVSNASLIQSNEFMSPYCVLSFHYMLAE